MKLHELEVGEADACSVCRSHSLPESTGRIRCPLPKGGGAPGGDESGTSSDGAPVRDDAHAPLVREPKRQHALALRDLNSRVREDTLGEQTGHTIAGRGATRMNHTTTAVAAFEAEPFVELDSKFNEVANPGGRLLGEHAHRASAAESAAGANRVLGVQLGRIVVRNRRRYPALSELAVGREERSLR